MEGSGRRERRTRKTGAGSVRHDLVANEILETAAEMFADRGFHGTGVRDIAERLGISRAAFYYYYGSKEKLLEELVRGLTGEIIGFLREIRESTVLDPEEKLAAVVHGLVEHVTTRPAVMRLLAANEQGLPTSIATEHALARRTALAHLEAVIAEGVRAGDLRPASERLAALAIFGVCNWVAWWYRPGGGIEPRDIGDELTRFCLEGLLRPADRRHAGGFGQAIAFLRDDVEHLDRLLGAESGERRSS